MRMDTIQANIVKKLKEFLQNHKRFKEECEVVYLMVEIRKILESKNNNSYKIIKFYCNWVLHNKLDYQSTTEPLSKKFESNIDFTKSGREIAHEMKSKHTDFFKLNDFKNELKNFFENYNLPLDLINQKNWVASIKLLLKVLEECPVDFIKSSKNIKSMKLVKDNKGNPCYKFALVNGRKKPMIKLKFK